MAHHKCSRSLVHFIVLIDHSTRKGFMKQKSVSHLADSHENVIGHSSRPGHGGIAVLPGYDGNQQPRHIHDLMDVGDILLFRFRPK